VSRGYLLDTHALLWWLFEAELMTMTSFDVVADKTI
jgi:PIN domain nuclease of toxin-antitoxin system